MALKKSAPLRMTNDCLSNDPIRASLHRHGYVLDVCLPILRLPPLLCSFDSDTSSPPLSPFRTRQSHWFHTIIMSRAELDRVFNNTAMKKCVKFSLFLVGMVVMFHTERIASRFLRYNLVDRLSARGPQHAHGIRAGQGGLRPAQNGSATSCPALVDLTPKSPSASLQAATKAAYGRDRLSPGHARHLGHLLRHPTHGNHPSPFTATAYPLTDAKRTPQPFSLDYTQTLLSLLDILSGFYAKLAKLLGPSPFLHVSQHMLGLSPHPGVSYLFQNQTQASATDDALGGPIGGSVLSSPRRVGRPHWASSSSR
jgi:hypothetical protein